MGVGRPERRIRDRGAISVLAPLFVVLLLIILALTINIGRLMRTRGDLQHAADTGALAAMEVLDNKPVVAGVVPGRVWEDYNPASPRGVQQVAQHFAHQYLMGGGMNQYASVNTTHTNGGDFTLGFWHARSGATERCVFAANAFCNVMGTDPFEPVPQLPAGSFYDRLAINAIKVTTRYTVPPILAGITGQGNTAILARTVALSRRQRIQCAAPFAVSSCQLDNTNTSLVTPGPSVGFTCPAGPRIFDFVSAVEPDVAGLPGGPGGPYTANGLTRVDMNGTVDLGVDPGYRNWVRTATADWQCAGRPTQHVAGVVNVPPDKRTDLGPIINGLLGITNLGSPPAAPCVIGQTLVVPMIAVDHGSCPDTAFQNWPYRSGTAFGMARVFSFVNFTVMSVTCSTGEVLTAPGSGGMACDADPVRAQNCVGAAGAAGPPLAIQAAIDCNAPVPTGVGAVSSPARLVR